MALPFLRGFQQSRAAMDPNALIGRVTLNLDSDAWNGLTHRQVIAAAQILATGTFALRFVFEGGSTEPLTISKAYVGHAAAAGDTYDFEAGTIVAITFSGGSASGVAPAGGAITSDPISFTVQAAKNLVISTYRNGGTGSDTAKDRNAQTGFTAFFKAGDDAITQDVTGYSTAGNVVSALRNILY